MPNLFAQTLMFVSSYAPLLVVFVLLNSFEHTVLNVVLVVAAAAGVLALLAVLTVGRRINPQTVVLSNIRTRDADAISYVVTYLVPFVSLAADTWRERTALLLFLGLLAVLYVRASLFYINPLLSLAGYHIHEATRSGRPVVVIARRRAFAAETTMKVREISREVLMEANP